MSNTCSIDDNSIIINGYKITMDDLIKQTIHKNKYTGLTVINIYEIIQKQCNSNIKIGNKFDKMCILLQNYDKRIISECMKIEGIYTNIYTELQFKMQYEKIINKLEKELNDTNYNNEIQYSIIKTKLNYQYKIISFLIIIIIGQ